VVPLDEVVVPLVVVPLVVVPLVVVPLVDDVYADGLDSQSSMAFLAPLQS